MKVIPLSEFGLVSVEEAARLRNCDPSTIRRAASRGDLPCVVVGAGRSAKFLLRKTDVEAFEARPRGAPVGNQFAKKEPAPKPAKTSTPKKSRKKSENP